MQSRCGIVLGDNKQYLVRSRLNPLLVEFGAKNLDELVARVISSSDRQLLQSVIEAMTTNETFWFRDQYPYTILQTSLLSELASQYGIRIWSAACSSGQEPYSIAMSILEYKRQNPGKRLPQVEIVATDLATSMLEKSKRGVYDELSLARGLSPELRQRYFQHDANGLVTVKPEVRAMVTFQQFNLLNSYTSLGKFDIVFCRNVLIYFSAQQKLKILQQIADTLPQGGTLFLGASESITQETRKYSMVRCNPGIYYRRL